MNYSKILKTLLLLCASMQTFADEDVGNIKTDCPPEVRAQYVAEMKKPMLTEVEIARYAALLPLLYASKSNPPDDVIKQFQELENKLNGASIAVAEKYPSCTL